MQRGRIGRESESGRQGRGKKEVEGKVMIALRLCNISQMYMSFPLVRDLRRRDG